MFFYRDGVSQASSLSVPLDDDVTAVEQWQDFYKQTKTPLVVCVSAAERRGILNKEQAAEFGKESANLASCFTVQGLGALHNASLESDRTVSFK